MTRKISVIICTRNRAHAIGPCLEAVEGAFAACPVVEDYEVVVVDNDSTDDTFLVVTNWAKQHNVPLRLVTEIKPGLSAARNCGIRTATGELMVFTDDDCCMRSTYISDLLTHDAADTELTMRSGSVVLGNPLDLPLTIRKVPESLRWKKPLDIRGEGSLLGGLIGCNMAMRREVLDRVGFFDENLGAGTACPAGEDTDFFYRAYLAGIALEMVPDMIVEHHHGRRLPADAIKLRRNYAVGNGALCAKYLFLYPNFSRHLVWDFKRCLRAIVSPPAEWDAEKRVAMKQVFLNELLGVLIYYKSRLVKLMGH